MTEQKPLEGESQHEARLQYLEDAFLDLDDRVQRLEVFQKARIVPKLLKDVSISMIIEWRMVAALGLLVMGLFGLVRLDDLRGLLQSLK